MYVKNLPLGRKRQHWHVIIIIPNRFFILSIIEIDSVYIFIFFVIAFIFRIKNNKITSLDLIFRKTKFIRYFSIYVSFGAPYHLTLDYAFKVLFYVACLLSGFAQQLDLCHTDLRPRVLLREALHPEDRHWT